MSFANFVHLCYIFPHDCYNWQRPSVPTQTGSKVQGRKLELIQAHFIDQDFLLKYLAWDGHITRGYVLTQFLFYALRGLPDPQTIFEVSFWMGIESTANVQKTEFNQSVKKQEETRKGSNMSFIKLIWSCICVGVYVCFPRSPCKSKSNYLRDWIPHDLRNADQFELCWFICFQMNKILWWCQLLKFFWLKERPTARQNSSMWTLIDWERLFGRLCWEWFWGRPGFSGITT